MKIFWVALFTIFASMNIFAQDTVPRSSGHGMTTFSISMNHHPGMASREVNSNGQSFLETDQGVAASLSIEKTLIPNLSFYLDFGYGIDQIKDTTAANQGRQGEFGELLMFSSNLGSRLYLLGTRGFTIYAGAGLGAKANNLRYFARTEPIDNSPIREKTTFYSTAVFFDAGVAFIGEKYGLRLGVKKYHVRTSNHPHIGDRKLNYKVHRSYFDFVVRPF